jgi:hypothetical protein
MVSIALTGEIDGRERKLISRFFRSRWFWAWPAALSLVGISLVLASVLRRLSTGATYEHWSRYVVMTFCLSAAAIFAVTRGIEYVLSLVAERLKYHHDSGTFTRQHVRGTANRAA